MNTAKSQSDKGKTDADVLSYITMRRALGSLGVVLPFVLLIGGYLSECCLRTSISAYYYSPSPVLHGLFVGILCAIGIFLITYKGYDWIDNWIANLAGAGALGVAIFPTKRRCLDADKTLEGSLCGTEQCTTPLCEGNCTEIVFSYLHYASAGIFFLSVAAMAWFQFTKTEWDAGTRTFATPGEKKKLRNKVYRGSAIVIVVCIGAIVVDGVLASGGDGALDQYSFVFWAEAVAVWAFAAAWLIKGNALFADPPETETGGDE